YCAVGGFWNSRKECCRISKDEDSCWQWRTWSETLQVGGFWHSRKECCRISKDSCWQWRTWSETPQGLPGSGRRDQGYGLDYLAYIAMATSMAVFSAWLVCVFAPFASGSGIPEIKTILGGFVMKGA
ncbi:hypothetical protein T484DRAFT_1782925, partial [Baffinella frigidus]